LAGRSGKRERAPKAPTPLHEDPKAFAAWARREVHKLLVRLAAGDFAGAAALAGSETMTADAIEQAMTAFVEARGALMVHHAARTSDKTLLRSTTSGAFELIQTLVDKEGQDDWMLEADVVVDEPPRLALRRITSD